MVCQEQIEHSRTKAIGACLKTVEEYLNQYTKATPICSLSSSHCDAMVLGYLVKGLASQNLNPLPAYPYIGISYTGLSRSLKAMELFSWCDCMEEMGMRGTYYKETCGIKKALHECVRETGLLLKGPQLDQFGNGNHLFGTEQTIASI
jgi:hypothetical protein